jgi:alpha-glucosidase
MRDFGYDVADYCDVDPVFGTLADFDALVARAHDLGLKVTIDQVYAHTSDQHPWFVASRQSRDNPYADWYVWEDPKPDGSPPSNWQSVFGGPAWRWDARRCQYYLHNFLAEQPQVNAHNPAVQQAILDVMRFWLDRGVDGFRIDALNFLMHEPSLRDNPPAPDDGRRRTRPFDYQLKLYNQSHADIVPFVERLRALCDSYGAIFTVAEVGGDQAELEMKAYTAGPPASTAPMASTSSMPTGSPRPWCATCSPAGPTNRAWAGPAGRLKTTTPRARSRAGQGPIPTRTCAMPMAA